MTYYADEFLLYYFGNENKFFLKRWESICATVLDAMLEI